MPNLEGPILNADAPTVHMKTTQKTRTKRVLPNRINMIAAQGSKSTTSSDHTMGLDRKSKQISKRGKKTFQKVSIVLIFISVIYPFLPLVFG